MPVASCQSLVAIAAGRHSSRRSRRRIIYGRYVVRSLSSLPTSLPTVALVEDRRLAAPTQRKSIRLIQSWQAASASDREPKIWIYQVTRLFRPSASCILHPASCIIIMLLSIVYRDRDDNNTRAYSNLTYH